MSDGSLEAGKRPRGFPTPPAIADEPRIDHRKSGMAAFLLSEVAFFSTLIVAYLAFMGQSVVGPTPAEALSLGLAALGTLFLVSSSVAIHLAEKALARGRHAVFAGWWLLTIALGATFLVTTAFEWHELIYRHGLTINRNVFGNSYYTLVGFHALHVTIGLIFLSIVLAFTLATRKQARDHVTVEVAAWYWHFVDTVWIVVFTIVYLIGR